VVGATASEWWNYLAGGQPAPEGLARGLEFEDGWILEVKAAMPASLEGAGRE
jgi:hypothetical protein